MSVFIVLAIISDLLKIQNDCDPHIYRYACMELKLTINIGIMTPNRWYVSINIFHTSHIHSLTEQFHYILHSLIFKKKKNNYRTSVRSIWTQNVNLNLSSFWSYYVTLTNLLCMNSHSSPKFRIKFWMNLIHTLNLNNPTGVSWNRITFSYL